MFDDKLLSYLTNNPEFLTIIAYALVIPFAFGFLAFGIDRLLRLFIKGNVF